MCQKVFENSERQGAENGSLNVLQQAGKGLLTAFKGVVQAFFSPRLS